MASSSSSSLQNPDSHSLSNLVPRETYLVAEDAQAIYKVISDFCRHYTDRKVSISTATHVIPSWASDCRAKAFTIWLWGPASPPQPLNPSPSGSPDLKEKFPFFDIASPLLFSRDPIIFKWRSSNKPTNGCIGAVDAFLWFELLERFHGKWIGHGTLGLIRIACYLVLLFEQVVTDALVYAWHPSYNGFALPRGFQTVTLEDVPLITAFFLMSPLFQPPKP